MTRKSRPIGKKQLRRKTRKNTKHNLKVKKKIELKTKELEAQIKKLSKSNFSKHRPSKRGGTDFKRSNIDDSLLLALHDPNVKEIHITK